MPDDFVRLCHPPGEGYAEPQVIREGRISAATWKADILTPLFKEGYLGRPPQTLGDFNSLQMDLYADYLSGLDSMTVPCLVSRSATGHRNVQEKVIAVEFDPDSEWVTKLQSYITQIEGEGGKRETYPRQ